MTDLTDAELLRFIAGFVGFMEFHEHPHPPTAYLYARKDSDSEWQRLPDYLHSVDAWLRDVWPKVEADELKYEFWLHELQKICEGKGHNIRKSINSDARSRCLALYRALDGALPQEKSK